MPDSVRALLFVAGGAVIAGATTLVVRQGFHPVGTIPFVAVTATILAYLLFAPGYDPGAEREAKGLCAPCGYDLTGNVSGVCPECGTAAAGGDG